MGVLSVVYPINNYVSPKINVAVVYDVRVVREGIANLLLTHPDFVVSEFSEPINEPMHELTSLGCESPVDVVLLDSGSGITDLAQRIHRVKRQFYGAKVLVIGVTKTVFGGAYVSFWSTYIRFQI